MNLLHAIGNSLIHILWQSAIVYLVCSLIYKLYKTKPRIVYIAAIVSQIIIFLLFVLNVIYFSHSKNSELFTTPFKGIDYIPYLTAAYFIFLFYSIIVTYIDQRNIKKILTDTCQFSHSRWQTYLKGACEKLNITRSIQLVTGNKSPLIFTKNFLKPLIYLPASIFTGLNAAEIEALILHELVHIKRNDYLLNLLQVMIEKILYFNPLVKHLGHIARKQREILCDLEVLKHTNSIIYSKGLFSLAVQSRRAITPIFASGGSQYELLQRINIINNIGVQKTNIQIRSFLACLICGLLLLLSTNKNPAATPDPERKPNNELTTLLLPKSEISDQVTAKEKKAIPIKNKAPKIARNIQKDQIKEASIPVKNTQQNTISEEVTQHSEHKQNAPDPIIYASRGIGTHTIKMKVKNTPQELERLNALMNKILEGESIIFQSYQISHIETPQNESSESVNYLQTENFRIQIVQNENHTLVNIAKQKAESPSDNIN